MPVNEDRQILGTSEAPRGGRGRGGAAGSFGSIPTIPRGTLRWWLEKAGRLLLLGSLLFAMVMRGAVTQRSLLAVVLAIAVAAAIGSTAPPAEARARRSFYLALIFALVLAAYLLFQSWSASENPWANQIWMLSQALIGPTQAAISVDPDATRSAIFSLASPFLFYAAGLSLFAGDNGGLRLMRWLVLFGVGFAAFGLLQITWLTDSLLLYKKSAYLDSLTSVFVNRNTAGTLLGVASFAALTLIVLPLRQEGASGSLLELFIDPDASPTLRRASGLALAAFALILLGLFLTKSRGALFSAAIAYVIVLPLLAMDSDRWRARRRKAAGPSRKTALAYVLLLAAGAFAVIALVAVFGGLAVDRMETRGIDAARVCVYRSTFKAFQANWLFGTGLGTFSTVFPIYRLPDCGGTGDLFLRAHNVFLEALLGLGVPFVGFVSLFYAHVGANLARGLRERRRLGVVPLAAIGAVTLVTLHSLVDFSLQIPAMAAYFACFLAAGTTICLGKVRRNAPGVP